jgi:hypothetical protein
VEGVQRSSAIWWGVAARVDGDAGFVGVERLEDGVLEVQQLRRHEVSAPDGARRVSSSGCPAAILAMLERGWKSSLSASAQPVRRASSAATALLPEPDTPITTSCIGLIP